MIFLKDLLGVVSKRNSSGCDKWAELPDGEAISRAISREISLKISREMENFPGNRTSGLENFSDSRRGIFREVPSEVIHRLISPNFPKVKISREISPPFPQNSTHFPGSKLFPGKYFPKNRPSGLEFLFSSRRGRAQFCPFVAA